MLELQHVSKTFLKGTPDEHLALADINLHLQAGEFVSIIGSNGAGKSTLFNMIAGTFPADQGSVVLDGQAITYWEDYRRARMIARIFQDPLKGTAPDLTVEENISLAYSKTTRHLFSRAIKKKHSAFFQEQLAQYKIGLENKLKTKIGQLSGGQRQVVTLFMATINTPKLLLLDEHTAALDPLTAEKVLEITRRVVAENQITTMMITHNIASALSLGSRTIMLDRGRIVLDLSGPERTNLDVAGLLRLYQEKSGKMLDNDRMLLGI